MSVHHSAIHKEKIQQDATVYQKFNIPYLYESQHVSGDTPPIIRSLKLHWQPLIFHKWKVVGRVVGGRCQVQYVLTYLPLSCADCLEIWEPQPPGTFRVCPGL